MDQPSKSDIPKALVNFLFEVGVLSQTPRSGFYFLGSGHQSVAEHINRVVYTGFVLAWMEKDVNLEKVLKMCLFHDLAESRTSDLNYVHQKYIERHEDKAFHDLAATVEFGEELLAIIAEYEERKTREAIVAKDADNIEWILALKEQVDIGNTRAASWIPSAVKRLKTESAKTLATKINQTNSDDWWFGDKNDQWWVNRGKKPSPEN